MKARFTRHRLLPLLVSVLLHLALLEWLVRRDSRHPPPERFNARPVQVELTFEDPPPKAPQVTPVTRPSPVKKPTRPRVRSEPAVREQQVAAASPPPVPPEPVTRQTEVPRRPQLMPSWSVIAPGPGTLAVAPDAHGRTLRPGDPALQPESAQEEAEKLTARVQDWMDKDMAGERARGIGGHPYFGQMRGSLVGALSHTEGGTPEQLGVTNPAAGLMKNYGDAAREFGRTGSPGGPPPSQAPAHSEKLTALFRDGPPSAKQMMGLAQARETLDSLASRGALFTVKIEVHQARSGALLGARLEESSGNRLFDAFVLKVVPGSVANLAPPPDVVLREKQELRTEWLVEGWHHPPRGVPEALLSTLVTGEILELPASLMRDSKSRAASFEYRARLLKVY